MAVLYNQNTGNIITDGPSGSFGLAVMGPSHYYRIHQGPSPAVSQFHSLAIPPVAFCDDDHSYPLDFGFVDDTNNKIRMRNFNVSNQCYINRDGTVYIQGSDTSHLSQPITVKAKIRGKINEKTMYITLDVTNNGASVMSLIPNIAYNANLNNFRNYNVATANGDSYSWDNTNKILRINNSGITNMVGGFSVTSSVVHYLVTDVDTDELTPTVSGGNVGDSISGTATASKYIYIQIGDTTHRTSIGSGATITFTWIVTYQTSNTALATQVANANTNYFTDLTAFQATSTSTVLTSTTPIRRLDAAFEHFVRGSNFMSQVFTSEGYTHQSTGSYTFSQTFGRDGYFASEVSVQSGLETTVKDEYNYMKSKDTGDHSCYLEIGQVLGSTGFAAFSPFRSGTPGDVEPFQILKAYKYYCSTLDSVFLSTELSYLNAIGDYLYNYYLSNQGLNGEYIAHGSMCYPDNYGNFTNATYIVDPLQIAITCFALSRLAELNGVQGNTTYQTKWNSFVISQQTTFSNYLWNSLGNWPVNNRKADGTNYSNIYLPKVDVLVYDLLKDTTKQSAMIQTLLEASYFWNDSDVGYRVLPQYDSNYSNGAYWHGSPWNFEDTKVFSAIFRYGTPQQVKLASNRFKVWLERLIQNNLLRPGERNIDQGLFQFTAGGMTEMVLRGIFGIDIHANYFTISPNTYKFNLGGIWTLNNVKMGNQIYTVTVSGTGMDMTLKVGGVVQSSNQVSYGGNTNISVTFSGRTGS